MQGSSGPEGISLSFNHLGVMLAMRVGEFPDHFRNESRVAKTFFFNNKNCEYPGCQRVFS